MDWREATSASGERPAVHPDCRHPIKISYVILSLFPDHRFIPSFIAKLFLLPNNRAVLLTKHRWSNDAF